MDKKTESLLSEFIGIDFNELTTIEKNIRRKLLKSLSKKEMEQWIAKYETPDQENNYIEH